MRNNMNNTSNKSSKRGFAVMSPEEQRKIASKDEQSLSADH